MAPLHNTLQTELEPVLGITVDTAMYAVMKMIDLNCTEELNWDIYWNPHWKTAMENTLETVLENTM